MAYISRLVTFTATIAVSDCDLSEKEATSIANNALALGLTEVMKSGENRFAEFTSFEVVRNQEISRTEEE